MLAWLRDVLGINKYAVCWDFVHCGVRLKGRNDFRTLGWATKRSAKKMSDDLSSMYGVPGSHWIEPVGRLALAEDGRDGDRKTLTCIRCEKMMNNILNQKHQPIDGLAFYTKGHYGSTYFDPMDGSYLELSICDECIKWADKKGYIFHSQNA